MQVTIILEFPASYCYLARGIAQVYLLYFPSLSNQFYDYFTISSTGSDGIEARSKAALESYKGESCQGDDIDTRPCIGKSCCSCVLFGKQDKTKTQFWGQNYIGEIWNLQQQQQQKNSWDTINIILSWCFQTICNLKPSLTHISPMLKDPTRKLMICVARGKGPCVLGVTTNSKINISLLRGVLWVVRTYHIWDWRTLEFAFSVSEMNHFKANLMASFRGVDSKVLRMTLQINYFCEEKCKMANVMLETLERFLCGMSPEVPAFKVRVLKSDFKFWIGVNEY